MKWLVKLCKWILRSPLARRGIEDSAVRQLRKAFSPILELKIVLSAISDRLEKLGNYKENVLSEDVNFRPRIEPIKELHNLYYGVEDINTKLEQFRKDFDTTELPEEIRILWEEINIIIKFWFGSDNSIFSYTEHSVHEASIDNHLFLGGPQFYDVWEKSLPDIIKKWSITPAEHRMEYSCQAWGFLKELCEPLIEKISQLEKELLKYIK